MRLTTIVSCRSSVVLFVLGSCLAGARGEDLRQWQAIEAPAAWTPQGASATAEAKGGGWSGLVQPGNAVANCRLECQFTIGRAAPPGFSSEHAAFCNYHAGRENSGYDLAAILRYVDRDHFYRVQVSSRGQEVAIWKPSGGFVLVAPAAIAEQKLHRLAVEARGAWIEVLVDGHSVARYFDPIEPVLSGSVGLAVYGSKVRFENVTLVDLGSEVPPPPQPQPPQFSLRTWHDRQWIFDRQEPIALLDRAALILWEVKLRRGYRPMLYWELFWKQYDGVHNYSDKLDKLEVLKQDGPELQLAWESQDPAKRITTSAAMSVTLDPQLDSYAYDVKTRFVVNPGKTWRDSADGLEYCNLIPYNVVGPATEGQSNDWPWWYQWVVYSEADGSPAKHPLSHNRGQYVHPKPDGGYFGYVGNNPVNPIVYFQNPTDPALKGYAGLCHWAHDIHFRYLPNTSGFEMPAGTTHHARYRVVGIDGPKSQTLLAASKLHPYFAEKEEYPVYCAGLNTFQKSRKREEPQRENAWRGGTWDRQTGHGDQASLRLEAQQPGKVQSVVEIGGSHFSEPIRAGQYTLTAWVKTRDVEGEGATIGLQLIYPEDKPIYSAQRLKGSSDWQPLRLTADLPQRAAVRIILELAGKGTAWFDDVEVTYPKGP